MKKEGFIHEFFTLYNRAGEPIRGELRFPDTLHERPVIIICHSFMAFKDWGFFPRIAERFAEAGYVSLSFNFSRNGVKGDGKKITNFYRFEKNTVSLEVGDLETVVDAVWNGNVGAGVSDRSKIILFGHSRGGGVAIIVAARNDRVSGLISWSAVAKFDRWNPNQKRKWRNAGYLSLSRDGVASPLRLGIELLNDVEHNDRTLDLKNAASGIKVPWLILHGKTDFTVPSGEAETLFDASRKSTTDLLLIDRVGHLYNAAARMEDNYLTLDSIIDKTLNWIQNNIK